MSPEDADDFAQSVQVRLVERGYDVFHRFTGRSSLKTYLLVVVKRLLLDWQNSLYGKWRPTVAAVRMGAHAVELERLIHRDRCTADEAIELVLMRSDAPAVSELRRLVDRLPNRPPRRKAAAEPLEPVEHVPFADPLDVQDQQRTHARIRMNLGKALGRLSSDDRRLILLRYRENHTVQAVAQLLQTDPKALYRRFDRVLRSLRRSLTEHGVTGPSMIETH